MSALHQEPQVQTANTREAFGQALLELARNGKDVIGIGADTVKSMYLDLLAGEFPERVIDVGIAEQNMLMVAAGMASDGRIVYVTSYSVFTSMRSLEQLRSFICYPRLNVRVVAGLGGLSAGVEGATHIGLEELSIVRCIPNLCVVNPCDARSTSAVIAASADYEGPMYIQVGRDPSPVIYSEDRQITVGKAQTFVEYGTDCTIIATGFPLYESLIAADMLRSQGIQVTVVEMHTLKPIDREAIIRAAEKSGAILAVHEGVKTGGLKTAIAEVLIDTVPVPLAEVSVDDLYPSSGTPQELRELYGFTPRNIARQAKGLVERKGR